MPNRYEREIEEILRNLEHTDSRPGLSQKFGDRLRRKPGPRMPQSHSFSWNFSTTEKLLIVAIVCALVAGGYAYLADANIITLILAVISIVCLIIVALSQVITPSRPAQSVRYGNVTITPLRRGPMSFIRTQWNLFMLKLRYRRRRGQQ
ncbi:MAG TPA: hypothetical protein VL461_04205 [Dictyobacter sp.]|jgi:hypothetical protein|nr:hypothetical protein [Dictyobacter sp.]